jgi:putative endonuclease
MADPRHALGKQGEQLAADLLVGEGARVLARNFRVTGGELDLVVEQDGDLVGVEVKTRRPGQPALPEEAVNATRLARLERALTTFAQQHGHEDAGWRIDVVAIEVAPDGSVRRLEHIRDAYGG